MTRTFPTRASVMAVTAAEILTMTDTDRDAYFSAYIREAQAQHQQNLARDHARDHEYVGRYRREELGD